MGGPSVAHRQHKVVDDPLRSHPEASNQGSACSGMGARDNQVVDLFWGEPCIFERPIEGLGTRLAVTTLSKTLLPDLRAHLTGGPPAIQELLPHGKPRIDFGNYSTLFGSTD